MSQQLLNFILLLLASVGIFYFIYNKLRSSKKPVKIVTIDLQAQALYSKKKHGEDNKSLSLQEKVELSWQFLTDITKQVLEKFSREDKKKVHEIGKKLSDAGMSYIHDVEMETEILQSISRAKNINKTKNKTQAISK